MKKLIVFILFTLSLSANAQLGDIFNRMKQEVDKATQGIGDSSNQQSNTESSTQNISPSNPKADFSSLTGKVWGLTDRMDSRAKPCQDLDGGGHNRRSAPIAEFKVEANGSLKVSFSSIGKGNKYLVKSLDLVTISKVADDTYRLKGSWIDHKDSGRPIGPFPYEAVLVVSNSPVIKDEKFQMQGMDGMMSNSDPIQLTQCTTEQIATLGKTDQQIATERGQSRAMSDASPEGKLKALRDHYTSMMAVQDCYDIRKNYQIKYIDTTVYNNARNAMRNIEAKAKRDIPGLNTDKEWAQATKEYSQSSIGVSLDINKKAPQNHTKNNQSLCNLMAMMLIDTVPKEAPKKNF